METIKNCKKHNYLNYFFCILVLVIYQKFTLRLILNILNPGYLLKILKLIPSPHFGHHHSHSKPLLSRQDQSLPGQQPQNRRTSSLAGPESEQILLQTAQIQDEKRSRQQSQVDVIRVHRKMLARVSLQQDLGQEVQVQKN